MIIDCLSSPKHFRCIAKCCGTCMYKCRFVGELLTIETGGMKPVNDYFCVGDMKGNKKYRKEIITVTNTGLINEKHKGGIDKLLELYGIYSKDGNLIVTDSIWNSHNVKTINICESYHPSREYYEYYEKVKIRIVNPIDFKEFEL